MLTIKTLIPCFLKSKVSFRNTLGQHCLYLHELTSKMSPPAKESKGRKRKIDETKETSKDSSPPPEDKPKLKTAVSVSDSLVGMEFTCTKKSSEGKEPNFKIASWNVNGIRAWLAKEGLAYLKSEQPDVVCLQEIKCNKSKIPKEASLEGYTNHWYSADKEGYSGVGMYFKEKPISVDEGIGISKHDDEGRVITAEFEKFYLVNTYIPNSGRGLVRHEYRTKEWDTDFRAYLQGLDAKKPVIWTGDLNVAHLEIDLANPKTNKKNAGFTPEERDNFSKTLESGFIDSFRELYPDQTKAYSFWPYFGNGRAKNAGWRLDYFVMSSRLKGQLCDNVIRSQVLGSDHCPVVLTLAL